MKMAEVASPEKIDPITKKLTMTDWARLFKTNDVVS